MICRSYLHRIILEQFNETFETKYFCIFNKMHFDRNLNFEIILLAKYNFTFYMLWSRLTWFILLFSVEICWEGKFYTCLILKLPWFKNNNNNNIITFENLDSLLLGLLSVFFSWREIWQIKKVKQCIVFNYLTHKNKLFWFINQLFQRHKVGTW